VSFSEPRTKALSIREMDDLFRMALLWNLTFNDILGLVPGAAELDLGLDGGRASSEKL
jgi:hypothetical protein